MTSAICKVVSLKVNKPITEYSCNLLDCICSTSLLSWHFGVQAQKYLCINRSAKHPALTTYTVLSDVFEDRDIYVAKVRQRYLRFTVAKVLHYYSPILSLRNLSHLSANVHVKIIIIIGQQILRY